MRPKLKIDKAILLQFEHSMRQELGIWEELEDLWKMSLYDHRAYKLLVITSLNKGKTRHDKILRNSFIRTLDRFECWHGVRDYLRNNTEWEDQPNYFNYKYLNDTAGMLIDFLYRKKYRYYYGINTSEIISEEELLDYVKGAVSLKNPENIIGLYVLLENDLVPSNIEITAGPDAKYWDRCLAMDAMEELHEYVIYGYNLNNVYNKVGEFIRG